MLDVFQSYPKIADNSRAWQISPQEWRRLARLPWVVTEKIHGANFVWLCDGIEVRCAKRKAMLSEGESFFGHQVLFTRLQDAIMALFAHICEKYPSCMSLQLYGELFGGTYPHPDVPAVNGVFPVQTGVLYAPGVEYCAFDLAIVLNGVHTMLDFDEAKSLCEQAGLMFAQPLLVGSFAEAMAYPHEFASTIPGLLGSPPLASANLAEGVVLKPVSAVYVPTSKGLIRPILKRKIAAFTEDQMYNQAQKWGDHEDTSRGELGDDILGALEWRMLSLVNQQRLDSAISKVGALDPSTHAAICAEATEDVWASLCEVHGPAVMGLSPEEQGLLRSILADAIVAMLPA